MTASVNQFNLYLSSEGDSFYVDDSIGEDAFPEQARALACKTHADVLVFLSNLKGSDSQNYLNILHQNNTCYSAHVGTWPRGNAHPCKLDTQIDFVKYKMGEAAHGVRSAPLPFGLPAIVLTQPRD